MLSKIALAEDLKVIDIGCGIDGRSFEDFVPRNWEITGIDILPTERVHHNHPRFLYVQQDAQDLTLFKDYEFDLAVSIGMLEHITEQSMFERVVRELRRVARQHIVVVPFKYCWIEPHYGIPFFPLLPYRLKLALIRTLNLSNHREVVKKDPQFVRKEFRWLSNSEYSVAFPDSTIHLTPTLETIAIIRKCAL